MLTGKWRVDFLRTRFLGENGKEDRWEAADEVKAFAFNGHGVRFFSSQDNFGELKVAGLILQRVPMPAPYLFEAFKSHYYGESFLSMLEHRAEAGSISRSAGAVTLLLPTRVAPGKAVPHTDAASDYSVTLSEDRGHLPTQIRSGRNLNDVPDTITEIRNELADVAPGVWAAIRSTKSVFAPEIAGSLERPAAQEELILDMSQSRFNVDIPPEVFEMAFPPGTVVHDNAKSANFVVSKGGEADYKAYGEIASKLAQELNAKKLSAKTQPASGRSRYVQALLIANGLGLLAVMLFVVRRNRVKAQSK